MQLTEPDTARGARPWLDGVVGGALALFVLAVFVRTLAPTVAYLFDDSLEFQLLAVRMAIAHPTGYPLYSILIKLATLLPVGDVAYRVNFVSAVSGALAVLFVYLAGRRVTDRFVTANNRVGELLVRLPALTAALVLAFGAIFWSQAVLAEVYAPQAALTAAIMWVALRWGAGVSERERAAVARGQPSLIPLAFLAGLMLTHHRLSVLMYPALVVYVLSYDRSFLRQPLTLLKLAAVFLAPLLLYLYLPIRGTVTSSLDGAYQNTLDGFVNWILGTAYTVFLTQNPLNQERDASYFLALWLDDLTLPGLLAVLGGFVALFMRAWREWALLVLALAANLAFALTYRVADIDVFFIPSFVLAALLLAAGLAGLLWLLFYLWSSRVALAAALLGGLVLLIVPFSLYQSNYARVDLSQKTDVAEYGQSILSQPLEENATLIGILGEMSLVRYFQETQGLRPDVETVAADLEQDRLRAVQDALARQRSVYLTRPLEGLAEAVSLSALGPLIEVHPKPNRQAPPAPAHALDLTFEDVKLLGYTRAGGADDGTGEPARPRAIPVTLYWQPLKKIANDRLVSLKLVAPDGRLAGQIDRQPVRDAYPTSAWRNKEYIADAYDVPVFVGAMPGEYALQVTLYDPESGHVYGQTELERVQVDPSVRDVPRELLGIDRAVLAPVGGIELSGYSLDTSEPYPPGAVVPLTMLWRMPAAATAREIEIAITDPFGKPVDSQRAQIGGADVRAGQYVRQELGIQLPAELAAGNYALGVTVEGGTSLPFLSNTRQLGTLAVAPE